MKYYAIIMASSKDDCIISQVPFHASNDNEAREKARNIWLERSESQRKAAEENPDSYSGIYISLTSVLRVINTNIRTVEDKISIDP